MSAEYYLTGGTHRYAQHRARRHSSSPASPSLAYAFVSRTDDSDIVPCVFFFFSFVSLKKFEKARRRNAANLNLLCACLNTETISLRSRAGPSARERNRGSPTL